MSGAPTHPPLDRALLDGLFRYCYILTGREDAAFDLLQASVEQYYRSTPGSIDTPSAWLRRVIRNRFIDALRRRERRTMVPLEAIEGGELSTEMEALEAQVIAAVDLETVWQTLRPMEREVLHLWAVDGLTAAEIAERTETPRNTILSRLHRVRRTLRARFGRLAAGGEASR